MWTNYLKIALRSLRKNKLFSFINLIGLSVGMASTLLIYIWVNNELSFDAYYPEADQIQRVVCHWNGTGKTIPINVVTLAMAEQAVEEIPEIESLSLLRAYNSRPLLTTPAGEVFEARNMAFINDGWLETFAYEIREGSSLSFYEHKYSIALSEAQAHKYFGDAPAIDQTLEIDEQIYTVRLIFAQNPTNSSFQYDAYLPMAAIWPDYEPLERDLNYSYFAFFKAGPKSDIPKIEKQLASIINNASSISKNDVSIIPITEMRFNEEFAQDYFPHQNKTAVYVFAIIGLVILLTASLNYLNLFTALISQRVKEIGVKKVVGADFKHIFLQIMSETLLLSSISFVISLALVEAFLPSLGDFVGIPLRLDFSDPSIWFLLIGVSMLSLLTSGVYPALTSAGFKPISLIRANPKGQKGITLRKSLVVVQFTAVIAVLICTLSAYQQMQLIQKVDVGYDRAQVVNIKPNLFRSGDFSENLDQFVLFKKELSRFPEFESLALSEASLTQIQNRNTGSFTWEGKPQDLQANVTQLGANEDLMEVFQLEMADGRWFEEKLNSDQTNLIINETAVKTFSIPEPVVGRQVSFQGREGVIIGVVEDFHFASLHHKIEPLVIRHNQGRGMRLLARIQGESTEAALQKAEATFAAMLPEIPFRYEFIDDNFRRLHQTDAKMNSLFQVFAGLLIFISCLGLLGLAVFAAERRVKEIGIRKVLGASFGNLLSLLARDFVRLIILALLIAIPIAWFLVDRWLENFVYQIDTPWWAFLLAGLIALGIALLTISFQSIKSALSNPVHALRNE
ncbi:MAG: FtsX-like permease family protein [Bacteroidia bacterium]